MNKTLQEDHDCKVAIGQLAAQIAGAVMQSSLQPDDAAFAMGVAHKMLITGSAQAQQTEIPPEMFDRAVKVLMTAFYGGLQQKIQTNLHEVDDPSAVDTVEFDAVTPAGPVH